MLATPSDPVKPRALDLFCGAGGAAMGLHRAGFEVFGIDHARQPNYPFWFRLADALDVDLSGFEFIWASPPCQGFSPATRPYDRHKTPDLIPATRERLQASGALTCIENVPRAPIRADLVLQGDMFGLAVVRRRHFELNFAAAAPGPLTSGRGLVKYGLAETVAGGGDAGCVERWSEAMGIGWPMTRRQIVNAVPPPYAEHIGRLAIAAIDDARGTAWPSDSQASGDELQPAWPIGHPESGVTRPPLGQVRPGPQRPSGNGRTMLGQADARA